MEKVIVIVVKNGTKHQIGIDKSVASVLNEISACKSDFYQIIDACAIKISEIVSVEQFEYNPEPLETDVEGELINRIDELSSGMTGEISVGKADKDD